MTSPTASPLPTAFDTAALFAPAAVVEKHMDAFLDQRPMADNLRDAAKYALLGGGKRLRPILAVRCCEAVGGRVEDALPAGAAIEMIHAFSLAHDDLPAMDDDDLRRGRPTLHRAFDEAMAILAGDALTSLAFEVVLTQVNPVERAALIARELASATTDMIIGQVHDTLPTFAAATPPLERLKTIHRHKTGALIRCACRMGAIAGGASTSGGAGAGGGQLQLITTYAETIGLMFQVVDDLLDVTQSTEQLGKGAGKDADKGKLTYPGVLGIDATKAEVQRLHRAALDALSSFGAEADPLRTLANFMAVRTK
jgi:geranylgeranyl pyrophosphate synthase